MFVFLTNLAGTSKSRGHLPSLIATAAWLALIATLTLWPDPAAAAAAEASPWWCVSCGEAGTADLILNLLLFAPVGLGLRLSGWRLSGVALTALAVSVAIELTQGWFLAGRDAALGDVLANTAGAIVGWGLPTLLATADRSRRMAPLILLSFVAQLVAASWLNRLEIRPADIARIRIAPELPGRAVYRGTVTSLSLAGRALIGDETIGDRGETLSATFTSSGPEATDGVPIVRVEDHHGWPIAAIGADGDGIAIGVRTRGARLRLRSPTWLVPFAADSTGRLVRATLTSVHGHVVATGGTITHAREVTVRYGAQHGWTLLNPFTPVASGDRSWLWWTLAWLSGWGVLLGWAAAMGRRPALVGLTAVAAMLVVTQLGGTLATWPELVALAAGWLAGLRTTRLRRSPAGA